MKYNIETTLKFIEENEQINFLFFWGHQVSKAGNITKSCLSQWWSSKFEDEGKLYHTAEHYMMAQKALLFEDFEIMDSIISSSNPKEVKALGRKVKNFNEKKWNDNKYQIVRKGNLLKFTQDQSLSEFLKSTGSSIIVEASPVDRIWGVGMAEDNPNINDPSNWNGPNLLGFALMEVRDNINQNKQS